MMEIVFTFPWREHLRCAASILRPKHQGCSSQLGRIHFLEGTASMTWRWRRAVRIWWQSRGSIPGPVRQKRVLPFSITVCSDRTQDQATLKEASATDRNAAINEFAGAGNTASTAAR